MTIYNSFENGKIATLSEIIESKDKDFNPHKTFKGVYLKHLVTGAETNNAISCHLVKVDPYCILDTHTHENNLEIHEVIYGDGVCYIKENKIDYNVGTVGVIKAATSHKVMAGERGLYILAKFTPALL